MSFGLRVITGVVLKRLSVFIEHLLCEFEDAEDCGRCRRRIMYVSIREECVLVVYVLL